MDFRMESIFELAGRVRAREMSAQEVVQASLDRIDELNPRLHAFVDVDPVTSLAAAAEVDDIIAEGRDPGPLAGIPLAVKDLEDAAGYPTTRGSKALPPRHAERDSELVTRLRAAGCVVVGKTNTPELGWKAETDNRRFGATFNPWGDALSPGGSSGGSAVAIASGMVPLATGSDGGGSIRIPAAMCGLAGFKPSLGRVPSGGQHPPDWHHLSTRGPMARRTADIALALDVVIGPDATDLRSLPMPEPSWYGALADAHTPAQVAWSPNLGYGETDAEVLAACEAALDRLRASGVEVVELDVFDEDAIVSWLTMSNAYNLRTLQHLRGTPEWDDLDPGLVAQLEWVASATAVDLVRAEDECHRLNLRLVEIFHDVRVLLTPTTAAAAPRSGEPGVINGAPSANWVRYTYPFNMTRSPAGTVPVGLTGDGRPVGMQVIGPQHGDLVVLRTMAAIEDLLALDLLAPI